MKPFLPLALTLPILLSACGGDNNSSSAGSTQLESSSRTTPLNEQEVGKNLRMNLDLAKLQSAGVTADRIVVSITKDEFTKIIEVEHIDYSATAEFSNLALGEYQITVEIFDGETLVAEGAGTGTVSANQLATVDLRLELMSGGLAVNVCVPGSASEEDIQINEAFTVTQILEPTGPLMSGELFAGAVPDYHNTMSYTDIVLGDEINITASVLNTWQEAGEGIKKSLSDNNSITLSYSEGENLSQIGCSEEAFLVRYNPLSPTFGVELTSESKLALLFNIDVEGEDYLTDGSGGFVLGSTSDVFDDSPVYRKITQLSVRIQFEPVSLEFLETRSGVMDLAFSNADLTELFDNSKFTHSIEIEQAGHEGELGMLSISGIKFDGLMLSPILAEPL